MGAKQSTSTRGDGSNIKQRNYAQPLEIFTTVDDARP